MLEIQKGILLSEDKLAFQASRSGGPGGQHVNKTSSKIILSCPLDLISGLSDRQMSLIQSKLKRYIVDDEIRVSSQKHRSQYSNRLDATDKLLTLLRKALREKKPRYKTKIPKSVREKRLKEKNIRSEIKKSRGFKADPGE